MPLPTSNTTPVEDAYNLVIATAAGVKSHLSSAQGLIEAGNPLATDYLVNLYSSLNNSQGVGLSVRGVDGLQDYAKDRLGQDYDINAAFMASIIACRAVTDWLLANMPGDGKGGFIGWRHQENGTIKVVMVDADDLAPLIGLIATALATFN